VIAIGGRTVPGHPSSFWWPDTKMLMTVYVDDLLLAGPSDGHKAIWDALSAHPIAIDPPEPLSRFLGRTHVRRQS
jgi:hypothetical protein